MSSSANSAPLAVLHCPACGEMVQLPAVTCPACQANLRTGLRPADLEDKTSFWHRRWGRAVIVLVLLVAPPTIYGLGYGNLGDALKGGLAKFGLADCAEPKNRWDDFSQEDFEKNVRAGYASWQSNKPTRRIGESATGPESPLMAARSPEEKLKRHDTQSFFAGSLMSEGPSKSLRPENNLFIGFSGEWEVAYIQGQDGLESEEKITAGEWTFTWINNGEAIQDVLTVPNRWLKPPPGQTPISMTTIRHFNQTKKTWEGFHIQSGQMFYFGSTEGNQNQIFESYQIENGPIMAWVFENIQSDSFQVAISQSSDNGSSYQPVGRIWAKKRSYAQDN
ncbi:MAG: zinc ribbon domain-containing protein [Deltaproteobacteria bacterium]|nr:zinc ribbon domain-containing protein [Deltaproteobacteria bacterium]